MLQIILTIGLITIAYSANPFKSYSNPIQTVIDDLEQYAHDNRLTADEPLVGAFTCKDPDLAKYMNYAMSYYRNDMDKLSKSIMNQIVSGRKPGQWLVHAQTISGSRQGSDWQTTTNSQVFTQQDPFGCFYQDPLTYILVLRVY